MQVRIRVRPHGASCRHLVIEDTTSGEILEVITEDQFSDDNQWFNPRLRGALKQIVKRSGAKTIAQIKAAIESEEI